MPRIPASEASSQPATPAISLRIFLLLVVLLISGAIVRSAIATRLDSWTQDEGYHIVAGVSYVQRGDFRLNPEHPPLVKLWVGAIVSSAGFHLEPFRELHDKNDERKFVDEATYLQNDPDAMQRRGRMAMWAFNALLLAVFTLALRRVFGEFVALGVLLILVIDPTVAAHLPLVLTDLPVSLLAGTAVVLAARAFRDWSWPDLAGCSLALGLALATKHSAPVFAVLLSIAGLVLLFVAPRTRPGDTRSRRFLQLGAVMFGALLILWGFYRFRFTESSAPQEVFNRPLALKIADLNSPFRRVVLTQIAATHLLPRPYVWGLADTIRAGIEGRTEARLFYGRVYNGNPPRYFFPGILFAKLPLGLTLLIFVGIFLFLARRLPSAWNIPVFVLSGVTLGFFIVLASGATYGGIRHALPAATLLSLFGGFSLHAALAARTKLLRLAVGIALLAAAASAFPILRPYEYYNELIGMRTAPLKFNDEGVESEQRVKEMLAYYVEHVKPAGEIPVINYDIGEVESKVRGLDSLGSDLVRDAARLKTRLVTGYVFIGGRYLGPKPFWDAAALRAAKPVARFGNLFIYRGTFDLPGLVAGSSYWEAVDKIYSDKPDFPGAEALLRQSLALDPAQYFASIEVGNLSVARGSREDALHAYSDALRYAPDLPSIRQPIRDQIQRVSTQALSHILPLRNPQVE